MSRETSWITEEEVAVVKEEEGDQGREADDVEPVHRDLEAVAEDAITVHVPEALHEAQDDEEITVLVQEVTQEGELALQDLTVARRIQVAHTVTREVRSEGSQEVERQITEIALQAGNALLTETDLTQGNLQLRRGDRFQENDRVQKSR